MSGGLGFYSLFLSFLCIFGSLNLLATTCQQAVDRAYVKGEILRETQQTRPNAERIIELLSRDPQLEEAYSGINSSKLEKAVTLGEHHIEVMNSILRLEKFFPEAGLDNQSRRDVFLVGASLHDIGKTAAIRDGRHFDQYDYTKPILERKMKELGFSAYEVLIAKTLVGDSMMGQFLRRDPQISIEEAEAAIRKSARKLGLTVQEYFSLKSLFYIADAGSYADLRRQVPFYWRGTRLEIGRGRYWRLAERLGVQP